MHLDELDKRIIAAMQEDFPLIAEPYQQLAKKIGITEEELLLRLNNFRQGGQMRKLGAVLRHREVGYNANALCAWLVPENRIDEISRIMVDNPAVTHCYARVTCPDWPYNLYTMIHARTRDDCHNIAGTLAELAGLNQYIMLYSTHEWKKASMRYFPEYADS
ncbi:MAG TPA: AsnC family transcriptional regulator [Methylomusa anaerophila]|uniref:siroheme decarboxylase n=1 Tax=Methylomusa anaerophila TaxID=1930071 RepID=A0A348AFK9_9FIRM|nr:AsnC family transcriptional regulator [Methylomusa anaerophila]BBB89857.1 hypothetical protein MAMMFC1_00491 [Methylomusa anaerophila]HML89097.1 AsnC family transcriptional regulator [Methylomusa anaerophila]